MTIIYLVMSRELLDNEQEYVETCRAFSHFTDACKFRDHLQQLFDNNPSDNETEFYVEKVQLNPTAYIPHNQQGATA